MFIPHPPAPPSLSVPPPPRAGARGGLKYVHVH